MDLAIDVLGLFPGGRAAGKLGKMFLEEAGIEDRIAADLWKRTGSKADKAILRNIAGDITALAGDARADAAAWFGGGVVYDRVAIAGGAFYLTWTGGAAALNR